MKMKKNLLFVLTLCLAFAVATTAQANPICTDAQYCESIIKVGNQTSPIYNTGDHSWLFSADMLFPSQVTYTDGVSSQTDPSPHLTYACSSDGSIFSDCSVDEFTQTGTHYLKIEAAKNSELFYNGSAAVTQLNIIDPGDKSFSESFTVIYHDTLSDFGAVPLDSKIYTPGASVIILGNLGLSSGFQPAPLTREGYAFSKWNTSPDQIGQSYAFGEIIQISGNLDLYPEWEQMTEGKAADPQSFGTIAVTTTFGANQPQPAAGSNTLEPKWFNHIPPFNTGGTPLGSDPNIRWYPVSSGKPTWGNKPLPGTGFSTRQRTQLRAQPAELAYSTLGFSLDLPTLNVHADIVSVPEEENGWSVDWLGDSIGLLEGSALPGEGISFIAGHNHLDTLETGPFLFLIDLAEDDRIFVRGAKGELLEYSVYANELFGPNEFASVHAKAATVENALVLITCENELVEGGYQNRRVVFARPN